MKREKPFYRHNCKKCHFEHSAYKVGTDQRIDIYTCGKGPLKDKKIIIRYSDEPSDYLSLDIETAFLRSKNPEMMAATHNMFRIGSIKRL